MKKSKHRMEKLKRRTSTLLIAALVMSAVNTVGFTFNVNKVLAETNGYDNMVTERQEEISGADIKAAPERMTEDDSLKKDVGDNLPIVPVATTKAEMEQTTTVSVTEKPTTEPATTTQPVTNPPTTNAPTTTTKVQPWGKNSKGQFVNGNKKVIAGATMKGIDVSKWNGKIDWAKVAASDVDYAIIRCGYGDDYKSQDDSYWETNVAGCEKYNIPFGVYIYSYATSTKQAKSEAAHVLRLVKGHTLNFPIYYDMEDRCQEKLSTSKRTDIANTFLNAISAAGYECSIYANLNWWNNYLPESLAEKTTWKWVAQYNDNACTYKGAYQMWQSTSTGKVSGIKGNVDINFWFGPVRTRLYNIQKSTQVKPTVTVPKPVTAPKRVTIKSVKQGKKKASVKWKAVSGVKGYQIQYSTKKSFKAKYTKSKTTKKTSTTIKKLKSKKIYYFRVRAYKTNAAKQKIYSKKWSKVKSKKIK